MLTNVSSKSAGMLKALTAIVLWVHGGIKVQRIIKLFVTIYSYTYG